MARKKHTAEEIVVKLRQVDVLIAQGPDYNAQFANEGPEPLVLIKLVKLR